MHQKIPSLFSLILALGLAFGFFAMMKHDQAPSEKDTSNTINAFMIQPRFKDYNENGLLHSDLNAKSMQHYAHRDKSIFDFPTLLIYTEDRVPWHIQAQDGISYEGTKKILLKNKVVLHQPQLSEHLETTIKTNALTVYPERSFAESNQNVTILRPGTIVHGKGVQAELATGVIKLLSQSHGVYAPEPKDS